MSFSFFGSLFGGGNPDPNQDKESGDSDNSSERSSASYTRFQIPPPPSDDASSDSQDGGKQRASMVEDIAAIRTVAKALSSVVHHPFAKAHCRKHGSSVAHMISGKVLPWLSKTGSGRGQCMQSDGESGSDEEELGNLSIASANMADEGDENSPSSAVDESSQKNPSDETSDEVETVSAAFKVLQRVRWDQAALQECIRVDLASVLVSALRDIEYSLNFEEEDSITNASIDIAKKIGEILSCVLEHYSVVGNAKGVFDELFDIISSTILQWCEGKIAECEKAEGSIGERTTVNGETKDNSNKIQGSSSEMMVSKDSAGEGSSTKASSPLLGSGKIMGATRGNMDRRYTTPFTILARKSSICEVARKQLESISYGALSDSFVWYLHQRGTLADVMSILKLALHTLARGITIPPNSDGSVIQMGEEHLVIMQVAGTGLLSACTLLHQSSKVSTLLLGHAVGSG